MGNLILKATSITNYILFISSVRLAFKKSTRTHHVSYCTRYRQTWRCIYACLLCCVVYLYSVVYLLVHYAVYLLVHYPIYPHVHYAYIHLYIVLNIYLYIMLYIHSYIMLYLVRLWPVIVVSFLSTNEYQFVLYIHGCIL